MECKLQFYFGYLVGTYPSLLAMQKLHMGKFLSIMTMAWAITILAMLGVKDFTGVAIARFCLGLTESCLSPGFTILTGRFYRQQEQPWRFGLWTLTNGLLPIPMLVIFYGKYHRILASYPFPLPDLCILFRSGPRYRNQSPTVEAYLSPSWHSHFPDWSHYVVACTG